MIRRAIPFVEQMSAADCGSACLTMVLGWFGRQVTLDQVREVAGSGRDGASVYSLVQAGKAWGLRGRGVKLKRIEDLALAGRGAILHWRFNHFVVLDRITRNRIRVVDPALGRVFYSLEAAGRNFTGLALTFEPGDDFQTARSDTSLLGRIRDRLRDHWPDVAWGLAVSFIIQFLGMLSPLLLGAIVDRVVPSQDHGLLQLAAILAACGTGFYFLAFFVRNRVFLQLQTQLDVGLTTTFMPRLISLPLSFFHQRTTGDLLMRLNSNAFIREMLGPGAVSTLMDGLLVVGYLLLMALADWRLALVVVAFGLARIAVFGLTRQRMSELTTAMVLKRSTLEGYQVQILAGVEDLKSAGAGGVALTEWSHLFADMVNTRLKRERTLGTIAALQAALTFAAPVVVLVLGVLRLFQGQASLGEVVAFTALASGFLLPLSALLSTANQLQLLESHLKRLDDVMSEEPEQRPNQHLQCPRLRREICLAGVSFRYSPASPRVLKSIDLKIPLGSSLAIVGRSGSGKTTLAMLLTGLYRPTAGRILLDGVDLFDCNLDQVRRQIASISQRPQFFGMSVRRNIALYAPEAPLEEVMEAARLAEIHEDISAMPMGYETRLWDSAKGLSWGQAQRLALARALAQEPTILLMDEATSALDSATEHKVFQNLRAKPITKIIIAHRLSTVLESERILMLADGRIVESGSHAELVAQRGAYWALIKDQIDQLEHRPDALPAAAREPGLRS